MNCLSKIKYLLALCILSLAALPGVAQDHSVRDSLMIKAIYNQVLKTNSMDSNLRYLTGHIGARISGSPAATRTVNWAKSLMESYGPDRVYLQPVTVPHWVRGDLETACFLEKEKKISLSISALGGSVASGGMLRAGILEVRSLTALAAMPDNLVQGKVIFFNGAMDRTEIEVFKAYLNAVEQRSIGAVYAARKGAVGVLVRSLTLSRDDIPHTGAVNYDPQVKKIPAAALSTNSADALSVAFINDPQLEISINLNCINLPPVSSHNVIAEIKGSKFPGEIITLGAHLDSWDLGEGASDDGTGLVQSMELLRVFKAIGLKPERTIRVILYMNEESGAHGATEYARQALLNRESHVALIESDAGGFAPRGFRVEGEMKILSRLREFALLLRPYKADALELHQRGVDLVPMKGQARALLSLDCDDSRLFDIHHSKLDTYDKINPREVAMGAGAMLAMVALISKYGL